MPIQAGHVLGSYRLVELIGRGGMGEVWQAQDLRLGRAAGVKVLPVGPTGDADLVPRFQREAASAAALQHPNILAVWDYGEQDGILYLVMPFVPGGPLTDQLTRGPLPPGTALRYLRQMADALDYAHEHGIVHRDVKPDNVLMGDRGHLYLADFGIALVQGEALRLTRTGIAVGTPEYMAPEQAQGRADNRSDLYALGIILYQMLTGTVPFSGNSYTEVLIKHQKDPLPMLPLRSVMPSLPVAVVEVVKKSLAKNPNERYQSGHEMADAMADAMAEALVGEATGVGTRVATGFTPRPPARTGATPRSPLMLGGLAGLIVLLIGAALIFALTQAHGRAPPRAPAPPAAPRWPWRARRHRSLPRLLLQRIRQRQPRCLRRPHPSRPLLQRRHRQQRPCRLRLRRCRPRPRPRLSTWLGRWQARSQAPRSA